MVIRVAALAIVVATCCRVAAGQADASPRPNQVQDKAPQIDAQAFFEGLVDRYRRLADYQDIVDVTEVVTRKGQPPHRLDTQIACRLDGEKLRVTSPGSQVRRGAGADLPLAKSPAMSELILRYNLWRAPHLAIRFLDKPLEDFRVGVPQGFIAASAQYTVINQRDMVQLKLRARSADTEAGEQTARSHRSYTSEPG